MARQVPLSTRGWVIELGAGTGVVTQALLEQGVPADRLLVVEREPAFVQHLRSRFPSVHVVQGDAGHLETLLPPNAKVAAIVSSLPLRSLHPVVAARIRHQWQRVLPHSGTVIQFTYDLRHGRRRAVQDGLSLQASRIVWRNFPPARVLTLRHAHR